MGILGQAFFGLDHYGTNIHGRRQQGGHGLPGFLNMVQILEA